MESPVESPGQPDPRRIFWRERCQPGIDDLFLPTPRADTPTQVHVSEARPRFGARERITGFSLPSPFSTEFYASWSIHVEEANRCAPCWRQSDDTSATDREVSAPSISTGMEQWHHSAALGIDAGEVWPFVRVAAVTSEREIAGIVGAAVLFRHDMFDMKGNERGRLLRDVAILAGVAGAPPNNLAQGSIHG